MFTSLEIYTYLKKHVELNTKQKNNEIEYVLECARPAWIPGWTGSYKKKSFSHAEALVYFYEQVLNDKIVMANGNYLDLFDYALDKFELRTDLNIIEVCSIIINFYFGYEGLFDCGLYIKNSKYLNAGMHLDAVPSSYSV